MRLYVVGFDPRAVPNSLAAYDQAVKKVPNMARVGDQVKIILYYSECKQRNYNTNKNKKNTLDRLKLNKYCPFCREHMAHNGTR